MATRFVRVDLSDEARDFRPLALEPGVPLLDRSNANAKILFRWLGGMVAEPSWDEESVNYYVRDDHGGRLEEVTCQPISAGDLQGSLKADAEALKERITRAKPETPTERALKKIIRRNFEEVAENPNRTDQDDYFFKYRDVQGRWRLCWCWGYQRVDQEPAPAVVCTDDECALLFVRRPGQSPKCPACEAALPTKSRKKGRFKRKLKIALLLLLIAAGIYYWYTHRDRLIATPETFTGPVGTRVEFKVERAGLIPFLRKDVTREVVGVVLDPAVAEYDQSSATATFLALGNTVVALHLGELKPAYVEVYVGPAKVPDKLVIQPQDVKLGIGTTARLKLIGRYDDGTEIDLTKAAEWEPQYEGAVYAKDGFLEGLAEGTAKVAARYRTGPESEYQEATTTVTVANIEFESLELGIDPLPVNVGRSSALRVDAVAKDGEKYSVLESSRLETEITPDYVASVEGRTLKGEHAGSGKLAVTFNSALTAGMPFEVALGPGVDRLIVAPDKLDLVVGEVRDLKCVSPSLAPISFRSSDPAVVEIVKYGPEQRVVGRSEGTAVVTVSQEAWDVAVEVAVTKADFESIAIDPPRLVVPVDHAERVRVLAKVKPAEAEASGRNAEIVADLLSVDVTPSPRFARFDQSTMDLHGIMPTKGASPQKLGFSFMGHQASAPVDVIVAPFRLALTPPGPVDLPLGQMMRLQGWANYSGGHRVLVPTGRLQYTSKPTNQTAPGLELRGSRVAALKVGAGPLPVNASYFGRKSNDVVFKSVEAGDVALALSVDRTIRLVGETGRAVLSGTTPQGDVELVPEMANFTSSAEDVLSIQEKSGMFRGAAPGSATVEATHAGAKAPTSLELNVYDPANARLVFEPESVKLPVDEVAQLNLYLEVDDQGKTERAALTGPGVGYTMTQPSAVAWSPPELVGVQPAPPFELTASYYPVLSTTATAQIEVVPQIEPAALRVVPSDLELAAGQMVALSVEQQHPEADLWEEVRPDAIAWTVPSGLVWTPATPELRPTVMVPDGSTGPFELKAAYGGKEATALLRTKQQAPDANAAGAKIVVVREPGGEYLPVGRQQSYNLMIESDGTLQPAANILWPDDFENDFIKWQAPVLTAKRPGYQHWFRAEVDGRAALFQTSTYEPSSFDRAPPAEDVPVAVKIISDQGQTVQFPVGAQFDDFRVEAHYADGFTRLVTNKAHLSTPQPPASSPVSPNAGMLDGVRPGQTMVSAEFEGVKSEKGEELGVVVTATVDVDQIRLTPSPVLLERGEYYTMQAVGYKNGKSVGIISGLGNLSWSSDNPTVAEINGPTVTAVADGSANLTAQLGAITSQPAPVTVGPIADVLRSDQGVLRLRVGESARIGIDLSILRGEMNMSSNCNVTPAIPSVVQYIRENHSLVGRSVGASDVLFTSGSKMAKIRVEVVPAVGVDLVNGQVVVEPANAILAPGQSVPLRVLVISPDGQRIDRTASAVLTSSDPTKVLMHGNRACAVAGPGSAQITAMLGGTRAPGQAQVDVNTEPITGLVVEPAQLDMSTGDVTALRILGQAASGTYELYPQQKLTVGVGGTNPEAVEVDPTNTVKALRQGQANLAVSWENRLNQQVPVNVTNNPWTELSLEPAAAVIAPGQPLVYTLTGVRGGQRQVLTPANGVQFFVDQPAVAQVAQGELAVRGVAPGHTTVIAQVPGGVQAEASLDVGNMLAGGTGFVDDVGAGYIGPGGWTEYVDGDHWVGGRGGYWDGDHWVEGADYVEGYGLPAAASARLAFVPDLVQVPTGGTSALPVRVVEVLADGTTGRDVTDDPALELMQPSQVATMEKTPEGLIFRAVAPGQERIGAKLGTVTADPLLISVGDVGLAGGALIVAPDPLTIWSGEVGTFDTVMVDPGGGMPPVPVDFTVTPEGGQGIVATEGGKMIRGLATGLARVVVTTVDPTGQYDGLSTTATVDVTPGSQIAIVPPEMSLQIGQPTPPITVVTVGPDGSQLPVAATLESMDGNVLAADPQFPGRFVAKGLGGTQIRAVYRGIEAFAEVNVTGQRFLNVDTTLNAGTNDFDVTISVLAAKSEGPLEYRVYVAGQPPAETWVPAQDDTMDPQRQQVDLRSPRMQQGPSSMLYQLVIEARDTTSGSVQQYPLTFRLRPTIERTDRTAPPGVGVPAVPDYGPPPTSDNTIPNFELPL